MKKATLALIVLCSIVLLGHYLLWKIFGVGLPAFFPYKNRISQECIQFSGDKYKPIWFGLIYKGDESCR